MSSIIVPLTSDQTLSAPSSPPESPTKSTSSKTPKQKSSNRKHPHHQQKKEPLTDHQREILQQIRKVGPKSDHLFQYDGFGLILCLGFFLLGCLPLIGFATISYDKLNGGTNIDTNENLKILVFVAPTTLLFAIAAILYRLTNQRYPWTEVTFDFLEGAVSYRTSSGLMFMFSSIVNKACCGCFCFASPPKEHSGTLNHEVSSFGRKRAMFHEIKEIGVGRKFRASVGGESDYEYVVGLKITRDDNNNDVVNDDENESSNVSTNESSRALLPSYQRERNPASEINTAGHITINAKSENQDYYLCDENDNMSNYPEEIQEKMKRVLADAARKQKQREEQGVVSVANTKKKTFELVPLDVCHSEESVKATIKFWRRWMRKQYDSADRMKPEELDEVVPNTTVTTRNDDVPSAEAEEDEDEDQNDDEYDEKEDDEKDEDKEDDYHSVVEVSPPNPLAQQRKEHSL